MKDIKWNRKIKTKTAGVRKIEILLRPSGLLNWIKFFIFRQDYWSAIKSMTLLDSWGGSVECGHKKSELTLTGPKLTQFYETRVGEYTVNCDISTKCENWYIDFTVSLAQN